MTDSTYVKDLFAQLAPRYELANHLLSGGIDFWWRHYVSKQIASWKPQFLLDVATGNGDLAFAISKKLKKTQIIGIDFCPEMLRCAKQTQQKKKAHNLTFLEADGLALPFADGTFDVVTIAFGLRNMASWETGLREMKRVLRPGGHLLILDFSIPSLPLLRPFYRFYLHHLLPRFAGWITGKSDAYKYMAKSIEAFPSGELMCTLLKESGFSQPNAKPLTAGIVTVYTAEK